MAKLKRNFLRGRMNKDLDERLVPNGEYRDAVNIQVSTSEGSDVGAVENILGNTIKNFEGSGDWDDNFGLSNAVCIGTVRDSQNEKIYWFITSDSIDAIMEFDQPSGIVSPVLVDTNNVLNFSGDYLITGVNILEGLLYWTDDLNEPKVINIDTFKAGSAQGSNVLSVHTQVYGRNFVEKDTTVITEVPPTPLFATPSASLVGGPGTGVNPITTNNSPGLAFQNVSGGDERQISWSDSLSLVVWDAGSRAVFTAEINQEDGSTDKYQVIGSLSGSQGASTPLNSISYAWVTVESATPNIPNVALSWNMLLIEDEPIFKNDFPRFSYRYKFTDGRYSTYAPFSLAAFIAGKFKYLSRDGNNEGMNNAIRKITISGFPAIPDNVEEVELLYKGVSSNNVYVVETFDASLVPVSFDITSGLLGTIIESVQMLRLFDNVPRIAKAQDVVANRIVYGNYLQNYDVTASDIRLSAGVVNGTHSNIGFGIPSIKSDREYQLGVSFVDKYGRESPIFTTAEAGVSFNIENAKNVNYIEAVLNSSSIPSWASYYKYYIKNNTPEYYNLALDRYYDAEDSSVWLSFPSSEINKIREGQYIVLKKEHNNNNPVSTNNRYKVLNVSNEAPDNLKYIKSITARSKVWVEGAQEGYNKLKFYGPLQDKAPQFHSSFSGDSYIQFYSENATGGGYIYKIQSGGPTGEIETIGGDDYAVFECVLIENLKSIDTWLSTLDTTTGKATVILYTNKINNSKEFIGRFFAKINKNATLSNSIEAAFSTAVPDIIQDETKSILNNDAPATPTLIPRLYWNEPYTVGGSLGNGLTVGSPTFYITALDTSSTNWTQNVDNIRGFWEKLVPGTYVNFRKGNGAILPGTYQIIDISEQENNPRDTGATGVSITKTLLLDRPYEDPDPSFGFPEGDIIVYKERFKGDTLELSSQNPAIFETEPDELADLDIYWEVGGLLDKTNRPPTPYYIPWYNCYSFGNGVESDRIRDDFNAPIIGKGVRVNAELQEPYKQERRASGLIYGGLYNSLSSVNNTNQFIAGIKITKDLDPQYGGIQKLHSRDTNLVAFAEDKVFRILADKDALYNADGNVNLTSTNRVLGDASTFAGEFGISKNPESFASYGFRAYFTDKSRGSVLRLSADGITEISEKGMSDYFIDKFKSVTTPLIGSFDEDTSSYNLAVGTESVSFKEKVDGWPTRLTYTPEFAVSLNNEYYTFSGGELWEHSSATRSNFYGTQYNSSVSPIFNDSPESIKNFKTLAYSGSEGWKASVVTDLQDGIVENWKKKENLFFNYIKGLESTWDNAAQAGTLDLSEFTTQGIGNPPVGGIGVPGATHEIVFGQAINVSAAAGDSLYRVNPANNDVELLGPINSVDGSRLVYTPSISTITSTNDYVFFVKNNIFNTSGLLGYYGETTLTTTLNSKVELFGVSAEVFISSE